MSVPLIPLEVLFGNPERTSPAISRDGKRLAYLAPLNGVLNVWLGAIGSDDFKPITHDVDRGIRAFAFAHDNKHLLWIQDKGGDENWRAYDVDLDTGEERDLTPFDGVQVRFVGFDRRFPNELLLGINKDNPKLHDVYHLDLITAELGKIIDNPGFLRWITDPDFQVRGATRQRADGGADTLVRETVADEWSVVAEFPLEEAANSGAIGFTRDGRGLHMRTSVDSNTSRLVHLDLDTGEATEIASDPTYDVSSVTRHPETLEVQIVTFSKEKPVRLVLDEKIQGDVEKIAALDRGEWFLASRDHADETWLVGFLRDDGPVSYWAWDRRMGTGTYLFDSRPDLNKYTMAPVEPFSFTSRDGLTIHGYLTFPVGVDRTDLPAVLHVHGGPWSRHTWGYNPYAQLFANRGYVCIEVNFRGSTGYGKDFLNAGNREWGAKMHDDLIDAVEWVIAQGHVDRQRIAIHGGSYGGYAALVGATFTPDVFRCAVDIVGPSNLVTLIRSVPPYWQPGIARFHARVGNPETEEEFLLSRSPLSRVDDIRIPILIGQGANDPRVKQHESEQIVEAMKAKGIPYEYVLFEDEGHGFAKPENRLAFTAATERFLATHLGGRSGTPLEPA